MILFSLLLGAATRRWPGALLRLAWVLRTLLVALDAVLATLLVVHSLRAERLTPEMPPAQLAIPRLVALVLGIEGVLLSTSLWLPWFFDGLERWGAALMVAVRQLRARKSGFLTVISSFAFFGVGLACFGLCFTISIMGGFGNDLKRKILGNNAHVVVDRDHGGLTDWQPLAARIRRIPNVVSATPLVQGEVMVTSQTNLSGVILRGIDPTERNATEVLRRELIRGQLGYLQQPEVLLTLPSGHPDRRPVTSRERDPREGAPPPLAPPPRPVREGDYSTADVLPGLLIGRELATNLHLQVGDEVRVVSPFGGMMTPAGPLPKTRLFRVAGVFFSGMYEYDSKYAFVTIPVAQDFFNLGAGTITSIEVRVTDPDNVEPIAEQVRSLAEGQRLRVRDWKHLNQNLFRALRTERLMMFVLLGIAIVVASFAIVATLLLFVMEKGREIAVLKAMGASDRFVAAVFVCVGGLIGLVGSVLGVGVATGVCTFILRVGIPLDPAVYYINRLPVHISPGDYGLVVLMAMVISLLATLYPAALAARLRPVEGMRIG